jgi:hypothetical protein
VAAAKRSGRKPRPANRIVSIARRANTATERAREANRKLDHRTPLGMHKEDQEALLATVSNYIRQITQIATQMNASTGKDEKSLPYTAGNADK